MSLPLYILDPTIRDAASSVRGVGRYLQLLKEQLPTDTQFVASCHEVPFESCFLIPFYTFHTQPIAYRRVARIQLAVIHDLIPQKYPKHFPVGIRGYIYTSIHRLLLRNYDGIITDSITSKKDIINYTRRPEQTVHVLYPILPNTLAAIARRRSVAPSKKLAFSETQPYFLYVGDVTWNKNITNIAKAAKIANTRVVFAGSYFTKDKLAEMAAQKDRNPWLLELAAFWSEIRDDARFILSGYVSDEKLVDLYLNAAGCVSVSRDEGFGFAYLEAASVGCPSLLGDIPVFRETARDSALFADPENPNAIADGMRALLEPEVRARLGNAARENASQFTPERFISQISEILTHYNRVQ